MPPQRWASLAQSLGAQACVIIGPIDAFASARRDADADDIIVVTGSTFVVAELREWFTALPDTESRENEWA
jgi:hypothetical protein